MYVCISSNKGCITQFDNCAIVYNTFQNSYKGSTFATLMDTTSKTS